MFVRHRRSNRRDELEEFRPAQRNLAAKLPDLGVVRFFTRQFIQDLQGFQGFAALKLEPRKIKPCTARDFRFVGECRLENACRRLVILFQRRQRQRADLVVQARP